MKAKRTLLGDCIRITSGFPFEASKFNDQRNGLPVARIRDVVRGFSETYYLGDYPKAAELSNGDLLIGMDGEFNIAPWLGGAAVLNQRVCKITPIEGVSDAAYLRHALALVLKRIEAVTPFVTVKHLSVDDLNGSEIDLPSLAEQRRIAAQLEQADRLRRTRRFTLELSDTFLPAAFRKLFGSPDAPTAGVSFRPLGDYLSFVTSGARGWAEHYTTNGSRFIRSLDVRMNEIPDEDAVFVTAPKGAEADRTRVQPDDVLLTITGSQIGRVAPVPTKLAGAFVSQHVAILRLKTGLLPIFASMYLSLTNGGQREIARLQYGQTKPGLNFDQIREFRVPIPPLSQQQHFAKLVAQHERLRATQRESLRQAEHLFQTLLHRAFAGAAITP